MTGRTFAAAVFGLIAASPAVAADIEDVVKAWKDREAKVTSFRFEWVNRVTLPKGRLTRNPLPDTRPTTDIPPHDVVFDAPAYLAADGRKVRMKYDYRHWDPAANRAYAEHNDSAFDGTNFRVKSVYDPPSYPPSGSVLVATGHRDVRLAQNQPVLAAVRGTTPGCEPFDLAAFEPTGRTVPVNGVACAEFTYQKAGTVKPYKHTLYLDPARGHLLIRSTAHADGKLHRQLDVSYDADPLIGWVPRAWEHVTYDKSGHVYLAGRCTRTAYELNPRLPASEFDLDFPAGARVMDKTTGVEVESVVQPDGRPGKAFPRGMAKTYDELRAAGPAETPRKWWWPSATLAGVCAGSAGLLGWRAAARARRTTPAGSGGPPPGPGGRPTEERV
jgi:hypothetical protein